MDVRFETARGCGYRRAGANGVGIYLVGAPAANCGLLPIPLHTCPTCGGGVHQGRGHAWIKPPALFSGLDTEPCPGSYCQLCPVARPPEDALLMWVGKKFYPTTRDFLEEGLERGISKRIGAIPRGFVPGETWVYLAHPQAVQPWHRLYDRDREDPFLFPPQEYPLVEFPVEETKGKPAPQPGVFVLYRPTLELVVEGEEVPPYASAIQSKFGEDLVKIFRVQPLEEAALDQACLDLPEE